jgi:Zn-dependent protease
LIAFALSFLVAGTVHEFAHAYSAYLLGDDTAYRAGRVTLNPIAHIDPFGFIAAVFMGFGWAKPVPVNPRRMRQVGPFVGDMITSFAGPISNILLATITALLFRMGLVDFNAPGGGSVLPSAAELLSSFLILNLGLAFFNMLPISPLDGSHVIEGLLVPELKA